jgi:uncharacterized surface protein with fasciclin (FAS1) repeats
VSAVEHRRAIKWAATALAASVLVVTGCNDSGDSSDDKDTKDTTTTEAALKSASMTPTEVLDADLAYSTFAELVTVAEMGAELDEMTALTMFVPSNDVFDELGESATDDLRADPDQARAFVEQYLVADAASIPELLTAAEPVETLSGDTITVSAADGTITVGGAALVTPDIPTATGYLSVIGGTVESD